MGIYGIHYVNARTTRLTTDVHCQTKSCLPPLSQCDKHACNFLLLGSDSRAGLSKKQQKSIGTGPQAVQGQRADTIIVVNVNAAENRTVVLHIPRDLLVTIPGHGQNKINSAFSFGPNTMVKTVEGLTGLKINHYVAINFAGFEGLVNALGGVTICVNKPMVDTLAGLNLRHVGCYHMSGRTALAFVRARHVQGDIIPDFSRISRQQKFMRALIQKALSAGSIFHLPSLIQAVQDNLILDKGLNLYELQDLTRKLAKLGQGHVLFRIVPSTPVTIDGVDYVQLVQPD
ncbi:MAG TPA: LCP family protein, partial [Actinomycetota bacterium]